MIAEVGAAEAPIEMQLPPWDFPTDEEVVIVTTVAEGLEVLRSPHFMVGTGSRAFRVGRDASGKVRTASWAEVQDDPSMPALHEILRNGDLIHVQDTAHTKLRRSLNPLFGRDAHAWFRDQIIAPRVAKRLAELYAQPDPDGVVRTDLVPLARTIFILAAAALAGFDGIETDEGASELIALNVQIEIGRFQAQRIPPGPELDARVERILEGQAQFHERFYKPSLARRVELAARHAAGEIPASELPRDLLMLIARGSVAGVSIDDPAGLALALQFIQGATGTSTGVITAIVARLTDWIAAHPEDRDGWRDAAFVQGAMHEVLRLDGAGGTTFSRIARQDVTLSTGKRIRSGQHVALISKPIGRDKAAYGPDADEFDPRRVVAGAAYPFGIGFGSGSHMCMGLPLILGQGNMGGVIVPVLQALLSAGMRADPERPPQKRVELLPFSEDYASLPVIFDKRA